MNLSENDFQTSTSLRSRRMKNIGSARYAREKETREGELSPSRVSLLAFFRAILIFHAPATQAKLRPTPPQILLNASNNQFGNQSFTNNNQGTALGHGTTQSSLTCDHPRFFARFSSRLSPLSESLEQANPSSLHLIQKNA